MNKKIFLFIIFIMFIIGIPAQIGFDVSNYGLKGKVKTMQTLSYLLISSDDNKHHPQDTMRWNLHENLYFNKQGNLDSTSRIFNAKNYPSAAFIKDTSELVTTYYTKKYFYDSNGIRRSGVELELNNRENPKNIAIIWPSNHHFIEVSRSNYDIGSTYIDSVWIGRNGRDSIGIYTCRMNDQVLYHYKTTSYFKNNQDLLSWAELDLLTQETTKFRIEIKNRDLNGNPTEVWLYMDDQVIPSNIKFRKYTYYDN